MYIDVAGITTITDITGIAATCLGFATIILSLLRGVAFLHAPMSEQSRLRTKTVFAIMVLGFITLGFGVMLSCLIGPMKRNAFLKSRLEFKTGCRVVEEPRDNIYKLLDNNGQIKTVLLKPLSGKKTPGLFEREILDEYIP